MDPNRTFYYLFAAALSAGLSFQASAEDKGFRWNEDKRKCVDSSGETEGRNPDFLGQCGFFDKADFSRKELTGLDLRGIQFDGSNLSGARIENSDLSGMIANNTRFDDASFMGSKLMFLKTEGCNFRRAYLAEIMMDGSQHKKADFRGADLNRTSMNGNGHAATYFDGANLMDTYFVGAQFVTSSLNNSQICGSDMSNVQDVRSTWRSAKYDATTRLPFSRQEADKRGMVYGPCQ